MALAGDSWPARTSCSGWRRSRTDVNASERRLPDRRRRPRVAPVVFPLGDASGRRAPVDLAGRGELSDAGHELDAAGAAHAGGSARRSAGLLASPPSGCASRTSDKVHPDALELLSDISTENARATPCIARRSCSSPISLSRRTAACSGAASSADYTFVNERLARHYAHSREWQRFGDFRKRPAIRTIQAARPPGARQYPDDDVASAIAPRRCCAASGSWRCCSVAPPPPPPPEHSRRSRTSEAMNEGRQADLSVAEQLAMHRRRPERAAPVTDVIDPIGLALDNFDVTGANGACKRPNGVPVDTRRASFYDGTPVSTARARPARGAVGAVRCPVITLLSPRSLYVVSLWVAGRWSSLRSCRRSATSSASR